MSAIVDSGPVILCICSVIAAAIAHPYGHPQLLTAQDADHPHGYRNIELRPVTYHKRFHFFAAPEEDDTYDEEIPEELLQKNINVVVIRTPENIRATTAIVRLANARAEEKTAIYVLNKEPDLREVSTQIDSLKEQKVTGPEVHFIKYKSAEEADLAARNIQVEYDSLRGPSEVGRQVTAALHNYVGLVDGGALQEMSLVPVYDTPLVGGYSSSPEGEPLPTDSFYDEDTTHAPAAVENIGSELEDAVSVVSSSPYLPPEIDSEDQASSTMVVLSEETAPAAITSDFVKDDLLNPKPETPTETSPETISPSATTKTPGRGSYKYFHSVEVTERPEDAPSPEEENSSATPDLSDDDSALTDGHLPPSESEE